MFTLVQARWASCALHVRPERDARDQQDGGAGCRPTGGGWLGENGGQWPAAALRSPLASQSVALAASGARARHLLLRAYRCQANGHERAPMTRRSLARSPARSAGARTLTSSSCSSNNNNNNNGPVCSLRRAINRRRSNWQSGRRSTRNTIGAARQSGRANVCKAGSVNKTKSPSLCARSDLLVKRQKMGACDELLILFGQTIFPAQSERARVSVKCIQLVALTRTARTMCVYVTPAPASLALASQRACERAAFKRRRQARPKVATGVMGEPRARARRVAAFGAAERAGESCKNLRKLQANLLIQLVVGANEREIARHSLVY